MRQVCHHTLLPSTRHGKLQPASVNLRPPPFPDSWVGHPLHQSGFRTPENLELTGMLCFLEPLVGQHESEIRWLEDRPYHCPHVLQTDAGPYLPLHRLHGFYLEDQVVTLTHYAVHLGL